MAKKSVSAILEAQAVTTTKRSEIPSVEAHSRLSDEVYRLKEAAQDAEAAFRVKEAELIDEVQVEYESRAVAGDFVKSLDIEGSKTPGVQVTFADKFSAFEMAAKPELQNLDPEFDKHFEEKREISLKETDDETIQKLISKLGEKMFSDLFQVKLSIVAKSGMDLAQFSLKPELRGMLKQQKPAVKLRKKKE